LIGCPDVHDSTSSLPGVTADHQFQKIMILQYSPTVVAIRMDAEVQLIASQMRYTHSRATSLPS